CWCIHPPVPVPIPKFSLLAPQPVTAVPRVSQEVLRGDNGDIDCNSPRRHLSLWPCSREGPGAAPAPHSHGALLGWPLLPTAIEVCLTPWKRGKTGLFGAQRHSLIWTLLKGDSSLVSYRPFLPWCVLGVFALQPREEPGQASAMRILYLLFPLFLLLAHSAAGSSLGPTNKEQCEQENGQCSFLKCYFPYGIAGKCSRFFFCCKE
uniref:Beta-defensin-like domain-containing protein n=1 Tax=Taeniopygia guttata TaxID=59729 RepID=A0A674GQA3_TAEGU